MIAEAPVHRRPCPTGCGRGRADGMLMCPTCWREVPRHLQREVTRTWNSWRRDLADGDRLRAYRVASDAAIASIP